MPHFKDLNGGLHFLDDAKFVHVLPAGAVPITDEEHAALSAPPPIDPKVAAQAEITSIERTEMIPRGVREFMLGSFAAQVTAGTITAPQLAVFPAYVKLKALDDSIKVLRAKLK